MQPKNTSKDSFEKARGEGMIIVRDYAGQIKTLWAEDIIGLLQDGHKRVVALVDTNRRHGGNGSHVISTNYDTILHAFIAAKEEGIVVDMRAACNLEPSDPLAADYLTAAPGSPTELALRERLRRVDALKL